MGILFVLIRLKKKVCRILTQDHIIMGYLEIRSHAWQPACEDIVAQLQELGFCSGQIYAIDVHNNVLMKKPSFLHTGMRIPLVVTTINVRWDSKSSTTTTIGQYTTIGLTRGADRCVQKARGSSA